MSTEHHRVLTRLSALLVIGLFCEPCRIARGKHARPNPYTRRALCVAETIATMFSSVGVVFVVMSGSLANVAARFIARLARVWRACHCVCGHGMGRVGVIWHTPFLFEQHWHRRYMAVACLAQARARCTCLPHSCLGIAFALH